MSLCQAVKLGSHSRIWQSYQLSNVRQGSKLAKLLRLIVVVCVYGINDGVIVSKILYSKWHGREYEWKGINRHFLLSPYNTHNNNFYYYYSLSVHPLILSFFRLFVALLRNIIIIIDKYKHGKKEGVIESVKNNSSDSCLVEMVVKMVFSDVNFLQVLYDSSNNIFRYFMFDELKTPILRR